MDGSPTERTAAARSSFGNILPSSMLRSPFFRRHRLPRRRILPPQSPDRTSLAVPLAQHVNEATATAAGVGLQPSYSAYRSIQRDRSPSKKPLQVVSLPSPSASSEDAVSGRVDPAAWVVLYAGLTTPSSARGKVETKRETVNDVWGGKWLVRESRETPHGFEVKFGIRPDATRSTPALIVTKPLVAYLKRHPESTLRDLELPVSGSTVQKLRIRLGIVQVGDRGRWWEDRIDELRSLGATEFARKHGVTRTLVYYHRRRLLSG